jgi:AcrR family transcriptional regulator
VRQAIAGSGLAQREFARRIGLDETKLSKSLRGTRRFSPTELARIADVADVPVATLIFGTGTNGTNGTDGTLDGTTGSGTAGMSSDPGSARSGTAPPARAAASAPIASPGPPPISTDVRRRVAIIETAARLFAARGLHPVRISEIAAACGMSTSAVYHYFAGKQELFAEVLRHTEDRAARDQAAVLERADGPEAQLRHLLALALPTEGSRADEWSLRVQGWAAAVVGTATSTGTSSSTATGARESPSAAYERWTATLLVVVQAGQAAGIFVQRPADGLVLQLTSLADGLGLKVLTGMISVESMREALEDAIDHLLLVPT